MYYRKNSLVNRSGKWQLWQELIPDVIPDPFNYEASWWQEISRWYKEDKGWRCEICGALFPKNSRYLETHHIRGPQHNNPEDLMALCTGCHADQRGRNHEKMKKRSKYKSFIDKYGKRWKKALSRKQKGSNGVS